MKCPKWLNDYMTDEELSEISGAVTSAEERTTGEIVPVVVRRSSTIGHVPVILMLVFILVGMIAYSVGFISGHLDEHWFLSLAYLTLGIALVRWLASVPAVCRWLTSAQDQVEQVEQRALIEFYNHAADRTKRNTGILLFISMLEHRAVVLADKAIADKLPPETWDHVIVDMLKLLKQKRLKSAMISGIESCGKILSEHFPKSADDSNEISNGLIIIE